MGIFNFWGRQNTKKGARDEDLPVENEELPDSYRPYGLCPRCNKQSSFDSLGSLPATFDNTIVVKSNGQKEITLLDRVSVLNCRNCNQPTVVLEEEFIGSVSKRKGGNSGIITWRGFFWWPLSTTTSSPEVPSEINMVLQEAKTTFVAQCYRASAVMSRRALEAIAVDKGITTGTLANRINEMKSSQIIDRNLAEWATEIRLIGNIGAHYDPIIDVTKNDAKQIILFVEELIKYMYIMPAEIARRRNS